VLGIPAGRPHLTFGDRPARATPHWKLAAIDAFASPSQPLAWIDDDHDESCHDWAAVREAPTKLVATEPAVGLTAPQAVELRAWASGLRPPPGPD